jgi:hypothetical protein
MPQQAVKATVGESIAPVIVWTGDGAGAGNALLVDRGARALDRLAALLPLPERIERTSDGRSGQLALEV